MIISKIKGGLGNQLFMYAAGRSVAKNTGAEFKLDVTWYDDVRRHRFGHTGHAKREFSLDMFNISAAIATNAEIRQFTLPQNMPRLLYGIMRKFCKQRNVYEEGKREFKLEELREPAYIKGYFTSPDILESVRDELRAELVFKDGVLDDCSEFERRIKGADNPICVHVRRGDYKDKLDYGELLGYLARSLNVMRERLAGKRLQLFVFSDDIPWCRENFKADDCDVCFVENPPAIAAKSQNDFHLMTLCRHFIIPKSTFSFWAAWLSCNEPSVEARAAHVVISQREKLPAGWLQG